MLRNAPRHVGGPSVLAEPKIAARRRARRTGPRIAGLSLSDSPKTVSQQEVLDRLGLAGDEFAERIFARCGVQHRHLELSEDFLDLTLQGRTARVEMQLLDHSIRAIDALGVEPSEVGTVLSASLYSLGCPSLAHRLVDHYEMAPTTDKYHLTGVGCASGVPLMRLAAQALRDHPDRHALVVAAESMSGILMRASEEDPRAKTVGSSLFGDGCAAALLSADAHAEGPLIIDSQVHQIGGTLGAVELECSVDDSHLHLSKELPELARDALAGVVERFLAGNDLTHQQVDHWIVHPGGRRIIESVESALGLADEQTELSWRALAEHGNVGTPSIMYVLSDTIESREPKQGEHGLIVTIGPGVTVGLMLLGW
ncbi:MAG TPA: 3-oxoacyl-[acyl-carrier-protein] synthase III C-terminal domain-containing protein [Solirubrobacteraceae bacterium]|nr:3-oxoacyl-[acyl-carrier-protein] synthase III C-terminal domain-containing protein [Solirubrobacteraceae bacterium]